MVHGGKKWTVVLIAALVAALLAGMGCAADQSWLVDRLREMGVEPAEGAEAVVQRNLGALTVGDRTVTVVEAAYAGRTLDVVLEFTGGVPYDNDPPVAITAQEADLRFMTTSVGTWTEGVIQTEWINKVFGEDGPERLSLTISLGGEWKGETISFAIDKAAAEERTLVSEKTVPGDGAFTVYSLEVSKSPLSQVAFLNYQCDLPGSGIDYTFEFLDAQGNVLDYSGDTTGSMSLPDGTEIFRLERVLGRDAEIAAVRLCGFDTGEQFGTLAVSGD